MGSSKDDYSASIESSALIPCVSWWHVLVKVATWANVQEVVHA